MTAPSTRPSMYSDSDPVTSPLITRDLPMLACSWLLVTTAARVVAAGAGSLPEGAVKVLAAGFADFSGSGVVGFVGELAGFHIRFTPFDFDGLDCCNADGAAVRGNDVA